MKRKKRFPPPPPMHGTYGGGHIFTVKPIENEPDPSKMIDVWCDGSKHLIFDLPDDRVPQPPAERNGHAPATDTPKEPSGDAK